MKKHTIFQKYINHKKIKTIKVMRSNGCIYCPPYPPYTRGGVNGIRVGDLINQRLMPEGRVIYFK